MSSFKALVCIVTCNRLDHVKQNIIPYLQFVKQNNDSFSFLLANDGSSDEYIRFCSEYNVPLLYSDEREGVGLSKNRVVQQFPNFDYYFFIEDDVELFDSQLFLKYITASTTLQIQHFNVTPVRGDWPNTNESIFCGQFGAAYIQFYTKNALETVGGWHTLFATYRRFGHTEHSYRCYYNKLTPAPFVLLKDTLNNVLIHNPISVTKTSFAFNENGLLPLEQSMIDSRFSYFKLQTLCKIHFNGVDTNLSSSTWITPKINRYDLLGWNTKRKAISSYFFYNYKSSAFLLKKSVCFFLSFCFSPTNTFIKHEAKTKLLLILKLINGK